MTGAVILNVFERANEANYWPNSLFTNIVNCGGTIGDAVQAFTPAIAAAAAGHDAGSVPFDVAVFEGIIAAVDRLEGQAAVHERNGDPLAAADALFRACAVGDALDWYFWPWGDPDPEQAGSAFRKSRTAFRRAVAMAAGRGTIVTIPFEGVALEGLFVPVAGASNAPVVIHLNGQHSSLHWHYLMGLPARLSERGVASLLFDHPGTGAARYNLGLGVRSDTESYVGAAIDWLEACGARRRVGVIGGSLGGYRAPRAAAFEPRIAAVVAWGAHYDMYDSVRIDWPSVGAKLPDGGPFDAAEQRVVGGLMYWTGTASLTALDRAIRALSLDGVMHRVTQPLLVVHGAGDRQLPCWHAERTVAEAAGDVELCLVTEAMGGDQHCNWDNPAFALNRIAGWMADHLADAA